VKVTLTKAKQFVISIWSLVQIKNFRLALFGFSSVEEKDFLAANRVSPEFFFLTLKCVGELHVFGDVDSLDSQVVVQRFAEESGRNFQCFSDPVHPKERRLGRAEDGVEFVVRVEVQRRIDPAAGIVLKFFLHFSVLAEIFFI
jgi:hypothetical protein